MNKWQLSQATGTLSCAHCLSIMIFLALFLWWNLSLALSNNGWVLVSEKDNIQVYTRPTPNSDIKNVKAVTEIGAPPAKVFAVLLDSDKFVEFMPYLIEARTVARDSPDVWYLYQRITPPWVSERDYTLRHEKFENPTQERYELRWEVANSRGPSPKDRVVRIELCTGSYVLEGLDDGMHTRITYQLHTDPGGSLPKWIANMANRDSVPALLHAITQRVADPNWRRP